MRDAVGYDMRELDQSVRDTRTHTDRVRLREDGVGAQCWSAFVPSTPARRRRDAHHAGASRLRARTGRAFPEQLGLARAADEMESVFTSGRIASIGMLVEGRRSKTTDSRLVFDRLGDDLDLESLGFGAALSTRLAVSRARTS